MQPDLTLSAAGGRAERIPAVWRAPLLRLALAWIALIAIFLPEWAAMAHQWWDISTYNHILLVPAILAWLAKMRAGEIARIEPRAWWPGLLPFAGALFVWLLGDISGLNLASQLGAVLMLQASVPLLLGPRVAAGLFFPLAYMLFLVPFGEELVPALQMVTADMTIALTLASGVPALVDGVFIDTPAGLFEVAEECSGVKFLIAMVALGTLVAHVCFRGWRRRALFMAAAVLLPILANGVRAWGTIYIAQSQGVEFAAGFDHIFYGWIFFALVMGVLLAASWPFFDRPVGDDFVRRDRLDGWPLLGRLEQHGWNGNAAMAAMAAAVAAFLAWSGIARAAEANLPAAIELPAVPGWQRIDYAPVVWWEPRAAGADHRLLGRYRNGDGREVDVFYALYSAQEDGREAGGFGEGALVPDTAWRWLSPAGIFDAGKGEWLQANGHVRRLTITWYRTGDTLTGRNLTLKLANIRDRLALRERPTATLILSAEKSESNHAGEALASFIADAGPPARWMDRIAQLP